MSEAEFEELLDAIKAAVASAPEEALRKPLKAANDNGVSQVVRFPDAGT